MRMAVIPQGISFFKDGLQLLVARGLEVHFLDCNWDVAFEEPLVHLNPRARENQSGIARKDSHAAGTVNAIDGCETFNLALLRYDWTSTRPFRTAS